MKLVLAEKPSVAMSLSKVIGADQRGDGYMEGNGYLVSWCVGHLVELSQPEAYDEKYAKWKYDDLPILPEHWQYQVSASRKISSPSRPASVAQIRLSTSFRCMSFFRIPNCFFVLTDT